MSVAVPRWGAHEGGQGQWEFATWAPGAQSLELLLDGEALAMQPAGGGWFRLSAPASAGMHYRFRIDGERTLADPASRSQPEGVFGPSALLRDDFPWQRTEWRGRPWREAVIYEVHVGAAGGSYAAVREQLPQLAALGITAIELMPVATFPGTRNWGYDGVLQYAPAAAYGTPDDLKALVDAAHGHGLMVLLDVVYNHFGPDGNVLPALAPAFFREEVRTPWGAAVDFRRPEVQQYFIDNALMWLQEYRFDGLRLDAVHAIHPPAFLDILRERVHSALPDREIALVLENERNQASLLASGFTAQWNDDFHNALHALLTGESEGYYRDFADDPSERLRRVLAEGFAWQGEVNGSGQTRGEPSGDVSPRQFVLFAQNHDQIGNRAQGERLIQLVGPRKAALAMALTALTPMIPLFFLGEPWGAHSPFLYFTDHRAPLDEQVREGRRSEFGHFSSFRDEQRRSLIPDPNALETYALSRSVWPSPDDNDAATWLEGFRSLLAVRRAHLVAEGEVHALGADIIAPGALRAGWQVPGAQWWIGFNSGDAPVALELPQGREVFRLGAPCRDGQLEPDGLYAVVVEAA
ncbi:malto-oligosyltrehalose trehalohydrolase [Stenotrophomonas aracearum]|jgi:maltooligosyltrehalose trehalohydrolase|uniref:Malto-oligosyltrehalose trehalohydrolase n=1 Tax=Stenotrophomonas aracearum TaxID=3003272 RepID=A0ABY9Y8I5_9GAMM|nr:malto-oligosyltrehalose trehalohydrolase [Stenotrophomonas sp. A5588]WNH47121.1 malto-oligosyltrehalose trehalohydrolase [Stenotrophomonas sp. A5588]